MFGGINIEKNYGKHEVLKKITFSVEKGNIIGVFGLNGVGKTTLLRILSGLDGCFSGKLKKVDFQDVAYLPIENIFPPDMTINGAIEFFSLFMEGQNTVMIKRRLHEINVKMKNYISKLSSGIRQYFKFLLTVYSGASVCLFDEPLTNLDVNLREKIVEILISEISNERLFLITTHEIKEFERIIDGFFILYTFVYKIMV